MNEHPRRNRRALLLLLVSLPLTVVSFIAGGDTGKADDVCGVVNVTWEPVTTTSIRKEVVEYCDSPSHSNCQPGSPAVSVTAWATSIARAHVFVCRQIEPAD